VCVQTLLISSYNHEIIPHLKIAVRVRGLLIITKWTKKATLVLAFSIILIFFLPKSN